jgi:hypothetical protein
MPPPPTKKGTTMATFCVESENRTVRVRAETFETAAIRGATKLGLRWFRRRPETAQNWAGNLWVIYGPHDRRSNGAHRIGQVNVRAV